MTIRNLSIVAAVLLVSSASSAGAQRFVALGMPDSQVLSTIQKLQRGVAQGDRAAVASLVRYPLRVNHGPDQHTMITGRAELLRQYDAIFTPEIRRALAAEKLDDVLGSKEGVPLGRGLVWMTSTCGTTRPRTCTIGITSINLRPLK